MQSSLAVQRCMLAASTSCVCLFGNYCNVCVMVMASLERSAYLFVLIHCLPIGQSYSKTRRADLQFPCYVQGCAAGNL